MIKINKIKIKLNDFCVTIKTDNDIAENIIRYKFGKFLVSRKQKCNFEVVQRLVQKDWSRIEQDKLIIKYRKNIYRISFRDFEACIFWNDKKAVLEVKPNLETFHLSIENFLRSLFALFLYENNGFLLHAACSIYKNKACVFCGHSGAGKTTLSNLLKNKIKILSDDLISVRRKDRKWFVQTTPFRLWDVKLRERSYPLSTIFALKKSKVFNLKQINFSEALILLMSGVSFLPDSKKAYLRTLEEIERIARIIPAYELSFPKKNILLNKLIPTMRNSKISI